MPTNDEIIILDGSLGHLLKSRGVENLCSNVLKYEELFAASSFANIIAPEIVEQLHQEYIESGATVITTNTFGCTQFTLAKANLAERSLEIAIAGASIARRVAALNQDQKQILVAGSLPPLEDSYIPIKTEMTRQYDFELLQAEYKRLAFSIEPFVDIFLCETMSSITEALAAATAVATLPANTKPIWVSFTLEDNEKCLLRSGERVEDAVHALLAQHIPTIEAILFNCCAPQSITAALSAVKRSLEDCHQNILYGGYANSFQKTTSEWMDQGSSEALVKLPEDEYDEHGVILPDAYAKHVAKWVDLGASIVGGCCGTSPVHIEKINRLVKMKSNNNNNKI